MSEIKEIKEAMKVLKEECEKHRACYDECPLYDKTGSGGIIRCRVGTIPPYYSLYEEDDE